VSPKTDAPVVVVGAGLAGLACATTLHAAGVPVSVIEAGDGVGGRVRTDVIDGHRCDRGFQVLLTAYPEAHRQLDMDTLDLCRFDPGAVVQLGAKRSVIADPFRAPQRIVASALSPVGSPIDKLKVALLRRRVRRVHPATLLAGEDRSTLAELRAEGFSQRMIDRFFRPLFGGIQLDPQLATSRRMFDVIFRMLADGDSAVPATGMQAIPEQMAARLPMGTIALGVRATGISAGRVEVDGGSIDASTVVVACEGPAAAALLGLEPVRSKAAGAVWFSAPAPPAPDRLVFLDGEGGPALNVAIMTNVAPGYAPPGRATIVAAFPGVADGDFEPLARRTLRTWWGRQVDAWEVLTVNRIPHGQPDRGVPLHPKLPVRLTDGVYVCGDHRDTASIQGALYSGRRCAEAVLH
jgi:Flavin containing amine oxidoreductase